MIDVIVHPDLASLPPAQPGRIPVHLYGNSPQNDGTTAIGAPMLAELSRVFAPINPIAFDFLSLALAVTAADTFVRRDDAADGWARNIRLTVALADPQPWTAVVPALERALGFLSGDQWSLQVVGDGEEPPRHRTKTTRKISPRGCDSACLFSGGLDSAIGVLNLRSQGHNPVLVSHAYRHDALRQEELLAHLGKGVVRLGTQANPASRLDWPNDVQMRTRSFNFLAMGVLMATALIVPGGPRRTTLFIPENGLIALNPPLTKRRIGALSTRTTHPYYLHLIQEVLNAVGLPVDLENPFAQVTKGEMIATCREPARLAAMAPRTVSCGKWKRTGKQCGRCVPCLIRRSAFHAAAWTDTTDYARAGADLQRFYDFGNEPDDLMAMILASRRLDTHDLDNWVALAGPLPIGRTDRAARVDAVARGMIEVRNFLGSELRI